MDTSTHRFTENIIGIIDKHRGERGSIIAILEDIQASYNYLPREALQSVATETGHSLVNLYGRAQSEANKLGVKEIAVSLSHSREYAIASVVGVSETNRS